MVLHTLHSVEELVTQRIHGLVLGYEHLNDHDHLRLDPIHGLITGKGESRRYREPRASLVRLHQLSWIQHLKLCEDFVRIVLAGLINRIAQGGTNRQIGMALKVSPRTIEKHVERILAKSDVANRTMAALLAARASDS